MPGVAAVHGVIAGLASASGPGKPGATFKEAIGAGCEA